MLLRARGAYGYDADFEAWQAAVATNSGTLSTTNKHAVRELIYNLKVTNLWSKIARINPMVGDFNAMLVPIKVGTGANATDTNTGFVSGNWTESSGLLLAAGKHLDTGLTPANAGMSTGNGHLGCYVTTRANGTWIGSAGTSALTSVAISFGNFTVAVSNDAISVAGIPDARGHLMANALSGSLNGHRKGAGIQVQDTTTTGAIGTSSIGVGALNTAGTWSAEPANGRLCGYHIGAGLTKREARSMGRIWQRFQVQMGRAYAPETTTDVVLWGDSLVTAKLHVGLKGVMSTSLVVDRGVFGQTATQIASRMVVGDDTVDDFIVCLLLGKNDFNNIASANAVNTTVQNTVTSQIASCVSHLNAVNAGNSKYLVMMTPNGRTIAGDANTGNNYLNYIAVANTLSSTYGASNYADGISRYRDTRSYLVAGYDSGTPQDVTDHGLDVPPSTLMADTIHWNSTGWTREATALASLFTANGW